MLPELRDAIRIAIADAHPIFRYGLKKVLAEQRDFEVQAEARDGAEALEVLQKLEPDILLVDFKMPGLSGFALLEMLQAQKKRTRVILLTGSDDEAEFVQAMKLGACGIVRKQTPTELLVKSIRKVHEGEIWLDSRTTAAVMKRFSDADAGPGNGGEQSPLSRREAEVVMLVSQGLKNKQIADRMFITEQTVKNHLHNIFDKLGVSDRLSLTLYAIQKTAQ